MTRKRGKLLQKEDEDEEVDQDLPLDKKQKVNDDNNNEVVDIKLQTEDIKKEATPSLVIIASQEFLDSQQAVSYDQWDVQSWILLLEEAEAGKSGSVSISDAYSRFVHQFPRAAKFWKILIDYHLRKDEIDIAEELFSKCLYKCRNIELWISYLQLQKKKTIDKTPKTSDPSYAMNRKAYENVFEKAVENAGMSVDSDELWREYAGFARDFPESANDDATKKLVRLRKVLQRAICIPMNGLEILWKEYEALEKSAGETWAEKVLPEYNEKYNHAKAIYKERTKFTDTIAFDRLATPPTKTLGEMQQLDNWNRWIRFEMTNPDNLTDDAHKAYMRMIYDQCLCCLRLHAEVWMGLARFEASQTSGVDDSINEARNVYREAIEIIPNVAFLHVSYAEFEEINNNIDTARDILKSFFDKMPSAFTFAVYQRFVRRHDGLLAARKLFNDTLPQRLDNNFGFEIYLVHAQMELEVNCCADVALKVLEVAQSSTAGCVKDVKFVRMMTKVLLRLGKLKEIQWLYQVALGDEALTTANVKTKLTAQTPAATNTTSQTGATLITSGLNDYAATTSRLESANERPIQEIVELWEDYVDAENILGLSDLNRMNQLRSKRDKARSLLSDLTRSRNKDHNRERNNVYSLFDSPHDISDKYHALCCTVPQADSDLKERSRGKGLVEEMQRLETAQLIALREVTGKKGKKDGNTASAETPNLLGVPPILREFLSKLPVQYVGQLPDIQGFIRHLKNMVLPPRPATDISEDSTAAPSWLSATVQYDNGDDDDFDENDADIIRDDVFRRRQRARLAF